MRSRTPEVKRATLAVSLDGGRAATFLRELLLRDVATESYQSRLSNVDDTFVDLGQAFDKVILDVKCDSRDDSPASYRCV